MKPFVVALSVLAVAAPSFARAQHRMLTAILDIGLDYDQR